MSLTLAKLAAEDPRKKLSRTQTLALHKAKSYIDGRTKQSHKDETDINKIMARFEVTGTISHLAKYEGVYADFSDFDFHEQATTLARGNEVFAALPAEVRREFGQSPAKFFEYVNNADNIDKLREKLPALAKPGQQLPLVASPTVENEAAIVAANTPAESPSAEPTPEA